MKAWSNADILFFFFALAGVSFCLISFSSIIIETGTSFLTSQPAVPKHIITIKNESFVPLEYCHHPTPSQHSPDFIPAGTYGVTGLFHLFLAFVSRILKKNT